MYIFSLYLVKQWSSSSYCGKRKIHVAQIMTTWNVLSFPCLCVWLQSSRRRDKSSSPSLWFAEESLSQRLDMTLALVVSIASSHPPCTGGFPGLKCLSYFQVVGPIFVLCVTVWLLVWCLLFGGGWKWLKVVEEAKKPSHEHMPPAPNLFRSIPKNELTRQWVGKLDRLSSFGGLIETVC